MSPTLSETTRRRLALGLIIRPANRNRRRHCLRGYGFELVTLLAAAGLFVLTVILGKL